MPYFKIKAKKLKSSVEKIPSLLGERAFLTFFCLFILSLILGGIIFFKDIFLVRQEKIEAGGKLVQFKESAYQSILEALSKTEEEFKKTDLKSYYDPFTVLIFIPEIKENEEPTKEEALKLLEEENKVGKEALTLYEFYLVNKESLPPIGQRAVIWEQLGLGKASGYYGSFYQNIKLLQALTK